YGMVIPNFVNQAREGSTLQVFGDGAQSRCFCHVSDVVRALTALMECSAAHGQVVNVGATEEVSVLELAQLVIAQLNSTSAIEFVPYAEVFGDGFEDMQRRVPSIDKVKQLIGWEPSHSLQSIIHDVARQA